MLRVLLAAVAAFVAPSSLAQEQTVSRGPMLVEFEVKNAPANAIAGGSRYLVYELHITNFVPNRAMTIRSIDVLADDPARPLYRVEGRRLLDSARAVVPSADTPTEVHIAPGQRVIFFLWIPVELRPTILALRHSVTLSLDGIDRLYEIAGAPAAVSRRVLRTIASPLRGGPWVAANGPNPADVPVHNQLLYPRDGRILIPQRYATDWVRLGADGRQFRERIGVNTNHAAFGEPVYAVDDGIVGEVLNDVPDNVPPDVSQQLTQQQRAGNYVILDIGRGAHVFYGHLQRGSIMVRSGQRVRRGELLGRIGNSGNSTGAHLHFQLTDGPGIGAEGVPFVFRDYVDLGSLGVSLDDLEAGVAWRPGARSEQRENDLPLGGEVVRFPA